MHNLLRNLAAAPLTLALAAAPLAAATYYVSPAGSNAGSGDAGSPWQTLQYAADHVAPGDDVIATAGNYAGFRVTTSGTAASRITFQAQPGATINAPNPYTIDGINIEQASYITIDGFNLVGSGDPATTRAGIRVVGDGSTVGGTFSQGVVVQNNTADNWGRWGIFTGFAEGITIQNNTTSNSAREHGIYVSNSADAPVIRGNLIYGNAAAGIHMNGDVNTGNTSLPRVDGVISGALVEGNVIHGNGDGSAFSSGGGSGINADGVSDSVFQNNLLYDNHASGISLYRIDGGAGSSGNLVVNNTVINAADARWVLNINGGSTDNTVFNNIFFNDNASSARGAITITSDSLDGFLSDYNLLDPRFAIDDTTMALAAWTAHTGSDAHSAPLTEAQMQALFADYTARDFTLAIDSDAIDAGVAGLINGTDFFPAPLYDLAGTTRPQGESHDAGAYEAAVPEPGSLAVLMMTAYAALARRRRPRPPEFAA